MQKISSPQKAQIDGYLIKFFSGVLWASAIITFGFSILQFFITIQDLPTHDLTILFAGVISAILLGFIAWGFMKKMEWSRTAIIAVLGLAVLVLFVDFIFKTTSTIFAGESVIPMIEIVGILSTNFFNFILKAIIPFGIIFYLVKINSNFIENPKQKAFIDRGVKGVLLATALSSILIVALIFFFTFSEAWDSIAEIGLDNMLLGTIWRPGSIIGSEGQFGLLPMIAGTLLSTFGAALIGVPLSVGTAILLAEVAPPFVRNLVRPAIELLAGIPSVVYGLFGMVVLAPIIRNIEVSRNTGFGILNASIVLAIMIIPTITNIAEDAIRAVPKEYKHGSLALGSTFWQTIVHVILPSARSGLLAAIILGIGRALGETMAVIMVIGNSIAIPTPLTDNPLTLFLNTARTLTGNIAVEINYAAGSHRSALFFTGILLFLMILFINSIARFLVKERA